ncbi:ThuA domain-containing protein [Cerasicoccus maritimus]|uniref:ThuA domain-containing protein n=1 Tax=Cerasicoccus maritimus TaxID=490089 RepID=UPI0028529A5D|nr:ThuA domain-containing protein [Cerasicoccus maritimus]
MPRKALVFYGGWEGHQPANVAQRFTDALTRRGYEVSLQSGLDCLKDAEQLARYDLIVPCVTMAEITSEQEANLSQAVHGGVGLAAAHGSGDAFRAALTYVMMLGGQFVSHPHVGDYTVRITQPGHALTKGLPDSFPYDSEQYYLHVDPGNEVLLATDYLYEGKTIDMPVAWTKSWGVGNVFYCALGHDPKEYDDYPHVWKFIVDGAVWASL